MLHGTGIFTYIWLKLIVNTGKYSSPMEHLGMGILGMDIAWISCSGGFFRGPFFLHHCFMSQIQEIGVLTQWIFQVLVKGGIGR